MTSNAEILKSEAQGGAESKGFVLIENQQQLEAEIAKRNTVIDEANKPTYPAFSEKTKMFIYDFGTFNSGDHRITEIKNATVKNNVLTLEVPEYQSGGMEIMVMSNPWILVSVPSKHQFNSVEITYSK